MELDEKKKPLRISPTHSEYAAYNASGCLDTCKCRKHFDLTRVNAPKISGSLTSGYPDIRIFLGTHCTCSWWYSFPGCRVDDQVIQDLGVASPVGEQTYC